MSEISASALDSIGNTDYMMNFDKLENNEYAKVWIKSGPFKDFVILVSNLSIEDNEGVSYIRFFTDIICYPPSLDADDIKEKAATEEYSEVTSWIVDDMMRRAVQSLETDLNQDRKPDDPIMPEEVLSKLKDLDFDNKYLLQ